MAEPVRKLNEILTEEKVCMNTLCRAQSACNDADQRRLIEQVLEACEAICTELKRIIRDLGGEAVQVSNASFLLHNPRQSLPTTLETVRSVQRDIIAEINAIMNEADLKRFSEALHAIHQFHADKYRWLTEALGTR